MITKTQFKTNIIKRYKNGESSYRISKDEGCSYNTVLRELKRKGINTGRMFWTEEEIRKLKKLYPITYNEELLKEFSNRSEDAIKATANKLGLKKEKCEEICKDCGENFVIKIRRKHNTREFCPKCAKKQWEHSHLKEGSDRKKQWVKRNPGYNKEYAKTPKAKEYIRQYYSQRRKNDPKYRINQNIANFIGLSLRGKKAGRKWESLVGYTLKDLMEHLENKFDEKMSWENCGSYWHIDHIKPRSLFKFTSSDEIEFKKCWALENLQPLERIANLKKGSNFIS